NIQQIRMVKLTLADKLATSSRIPPRSSSINCQRAKRARASACTSEKMSQDMKYANAWSWLWTSLTAIGTLALCSQSDPASPTPAVVQQQMQTGQWRITSFIDSGKDETAHFTGYTFQFQDNGSLTATHGTLTHTGIWSIQQNGSQDDNPDS